MPLTNEMGLPAPFVDAATSEHRYVDGRYSVTSLLKGVRETILQRRHADEITQDVSDMVWLIYGSAVHSILEGSQETATQLKENKLVVPMGDGYELSGIFDLYDDATGTVTDYKTTSIWKVMFGEYDEWRMQVLAYCWMLRSIGFDARRGEIVALLKDHSKTDAEHKAGYPQHPVWRISWDFSEEDIDSVGEWIRSRFTEIRVAESLPDDSLPLCTADERWHRPDKWAVKKAGVKRALKLYDSREDAESDCERRGKGHVVEFRKGVDSKCLNYCSACAFCDYHASMVAALAEGGDDGGE